jgi:hypothetical protein
MQKALINVVILNLTSAQYTGLQKKQLEKQERWMPLLRKLSPKLLIVMVEGRQVKLIYLQKEMKEQQYHLTAGLKEVSWCLHFKK